MHNRQIKNTKAHQLYTIISTYLGFGGSPVASFLIQCPLANAIIELVKEFIQWGKLCHLSCYDMVDFSQDLEMVTIYFAWDPSCLMCKWKTLSPLGWGWKRLSILLSHCKSSEGVFPQFQERVLKATMICRTKTLGTTGVQLYTKKSGGVATYLPSIILTC